MTGTPAGSDFTCLVSRDLQYYADRAAGLLEVLPDGASATLDQVRTWHPAFARASDDTIRSAPDTGAFAMDDAKLVYAREHGFQTWEQLAHRVARVANGEVTEPFVEIIDAGRDRDWDRIADVIHQHPELLRARGTNGNSLLNLACSLLPSASPTGDRLAPVRWLLSLGADLQQGNDRGWTPLHQAAYRNDIALAQLLLESGARADGEAHGAGGTPLAVALFWGHRETAELLADAAIQPRNLRIAASLGRVDLVSSFFTASGALTDDAYRGRQFYRPHSGFPRWQPSHDAQQVLDEALVWAAKSNRTEVMPLLVERGARVHADPNRGTPLLWAAANGRRAAAQWLLAHGADVNQRATFGGLGHGKGVTALHLAAQNGHETMASLLVDAGADRTIEDELYHGTASGWAAHAGHASLAEKLAH
ncbi:MAG: ankyrin repeat domain-containing protein [Gemmatimonadaceae bacterium]